MFKKIKKGIMNMANKISNDIMESNKAKYETIQKGMDIGYDLIKSLADPKVRRIIGVIVTGLGGSLIASSYISEK